LLIDIIDPVDGIVDCFVIAVGVDQLLLLVWTQLLLIVLIVIVG